MNLAIISLILLVALWLVVIGGLYLAMLQSPATLGPIVAKFPPLARKFLAVKPLLRRARRGSLAIGAAAPDFELARLQGSGVVRLSEEYRVKPVALVFGSYT